MSNFKRKEVIDEYTEYTNRWKEFENNVMDPTNFELVGQFERTKPNLIPLSDVYIYKNLDESIWIR